MVARLPGSARGANQAAPAYYVSIAGIHNSSVTSVITPALVGRVPINADADHPFPCLGSHLLMAIGTAEAGNRARILPVSGRRSFYVVVLTGIRLTCLGLRDRRTLCHPCDPFQLRHLRGTWPAA